MAITIRDYNHLIINQTIAGDFPEGASAPLGGGERVLVAPCECYGFRRGEKKRGYWKLPMYSWFIVDLYLLKMINDV